MVTSKFNMKKAMLHQVIQKKLAIKSRISFVKDKWIKQKENNIQRSNIDYISVRYRSKVSVNIIIPRHNGVISMVDVSVLYYSRAVSIKDKGCNKAGPRVSGSFISGYRSTESVK